MSRKPKILYLARWYPNRYDPMPGLFIQRHAEAAARLCEIGVVYTHVVDEEKIDGFNVDLTMINGVPTAKVYYSNLGFSLPVISSFIKAYRFFKANRLGIRKIKDELEGIDLIHVHVLTRLGLIALWYKWKNGIPYAISEHWSRYLPATGDFRGIFRKWITRLVVKNASLVTTVTQNLANAMKSHGLNNDHYRVLANVVPEPFYNFSIRKKHTPGQKGLIHVSCFEDKSKNISGLLRVIKSLSLERSDFKFVLVGDGMDFDAMKSYAGQLKIPQKTIRFTGLLEGNALVKEMAAADMLVIFSNYENFPVVINESLVLGVPVAATRVGGIPEYVNDHNGLLVDPGDEKAMVSVLNGILEGKTTFNNKKIRKYNRSKFSYETIGEELRSLYDEILKG